MSLIQRQRATEATLAAFRHRPFDWASGATCIHLAHRQAREMGHTLPPITPFRSPRGAVRALKKQGHETLADLLDAHFERIPPARMLLGDLAMLPGEAPFGAVLIFDGMLKLMGWHEGSAETQFVGMVNVAHATDSIIAAWRL